MIITINFLICSGFFMQIAALPVYANSLGGSDTIVGFIVAAFTVSAILTRPFAGSLTDNVGRRIVLAIGLCVSLVSTLGYLWLPVIAQIFAIRVVHGCAWSFQSTAVGTLATDNLPRPRLGEGMAYYSLAASVAMAIGPSIGLYLCSIERFDLAFYISAGASLLSLLLAQALKYRRIDKEENAKKFTLDSFIEKTAIKPAIICLFLTMSNGVLTSFIALYAAERGISNIGSFFTVYAVFLVITRPAWGKALDKFGSAVVLIPTIILVIAAMIVMSQADSIRMFYVVAVLYGCSFGGALSALQTMAVRHAPREKLGAANSTYFASQDAGVGLGNIVMGIVANNIGYSKMFICTAGTSLVSLVLYLVLIYGKRKTQINNA